MIAPVRSKPPTPNDDYPVNTDPRRLDKVYDQVLGRGGYQMLTEEVKWLAVTHKSFDHGRRGFNDRLALLGKRISELQISLALFHGSSATPFAEMQDEYGREPFRHPALDGLAGLSEESKYQMLNVKRTAQLAEKYQLDSVVRWKPKKITNLRGSGFPAVLSQALYAIVGAVALQKGGIVADNVVRERILSPLGLQ
ncbi:ribonuclease-III-like-domain-containing protein [Usnea florida]